MVKLVFDEATVQQQPPGKIIDGKFRIVSLIGSGGYGSVYKAEQIGFDRQVALKLLTAAPADDKENILRFEREARMLCALRNEHIVDVYSFGVHDGHTAYFAMQFLQGKPLSSVLKRETRLAPERVADLGRQMCQALSAAHKEGIIHRDLKPENVLLLDDDFVKVIDFGLSGWMPDAVVRQKLTQTGCVVGTVFYMSPEVCMGRPADERCDIYSLGCILYQCLSGRLPFEGDDATGIFHAHANRFPARLRSENSQADIPEELELIVFKALQKDPRLRFQSMTDLEDALAHFAAGKAQQLDFSGVKLSAEPLPKKRKRRLVPVAAACCAVLALTALSLNFFRSKEKLAADNPAGETVSLGAAQLVKQGDQVFEEAMVATSSEAKERGLQEALAIYEKAAKSAAQIKFRRWMRHAQAKAAAVLCEQKQYKRALTLCQEVLGSTEVPVADSSVEVTTRELAMDTICKSYEALNDYRSMLPWIEHSSTYHHRLCFVDKRKSLLAKTLTVDFRLGRAYVATGDHAKAVRVLQEAIDAWPLSKDHAEYKLAQFTLRLAKEQRPVRRQ